MVMSHFSGGFMYKFYSKTLPGGTFPISCL